jgi:hypothetical protein
MYIPTPLRLSFSASNIIFPTFNNCYRCEDVNGFAVVNVILLATNLSIWVKDRYYETESIDLGDTICVLNQNSFIIYNILHRQAKLIPKAHMTAQFLTLLYVLKYKVMD